MNRIPGRPSIFRILKFLPAMLVLLFLAPVRAEHTDDTARVVADPSAPALKDMRSIPYPNGAIYLRRGLTGAFLGGKHRNPGEDLSLYQWQGEMGYFYTPWFSGGVGFKITAGEPSDSAQKIFNRYFLNVRLHHSWSAAAMYLGAQLGMGNLNILKSSSKKNEIQTPIQNTKPTLGLDLGGGWKFSRFLGATLGSNLEYSLVDEEGVGTTNALNLHLNPGISLDILAFTETLRELVPAFYVNLEYQGGFLIFEKSDLKQDHATVLGVGFAF